MVFYFFKKSKFVLKQFLLFERISSKLKEFRLNKLIPENYFKSFFMNVSC